MKVIKFGGSSIADTNKLKLAAQKTISFLESGGKGSCYFISAR